MHLTDSGRLLSPILRPFFLTAKQAESLARTAEHFSAILDKTQDMVMASPALLSRVQMLPAEKMLAALPSGSAHLSVTCRLDTILSRNSLSLVGFDACQPSGLIYSSLLADLFLNLPVVNEFKRSGYKLAKLGAPRQLCNALLAAWREFGGKGAPVIAIVECPLPAGSTSSEGQLLAGLLASQGASAHLVPPENLRYIDGCLCAGPLSIDLVFRRISTREILTRWELSHPLLQAYREGAVCVVNSFRSEMGRRRAMLELLSDESFIARFPAADRKLIGSLVPWTRVVSARRTKYRDTAVDLLDYALQNRESLVLLPNEDTPQERTYVGAEITQTAWERALRAAQRTPYVVQERCLPPLEQFPFFQYGEFKIADAEVILQPQLLSGKLAGAAALLTKSSGGSPTTLGLAPVLLLE